MTNTKVHLLKYKAINYQMLLEIVQSSKFLTDFQNEKGKQKLPNCRFVNS